MAQAKYERRNLGIIMLSAGGGDLAFIEEVAGQRMVLLQRSMKDICRRWENTAREFLCSRWLAVDAIASELLENGRLSAKEVRRIVIQHVPGLLDPD